MSETREIEFTQYLLPEGRAKPFLIERPLPIYEKAKAIQEDGFRLECEVLMTGQVSFTIFDIEEEEDVEIEVIDNGPEVPLAVDRMIERFAAARHATPEKSS